MPNYSVINRNGEVQFKGLLDNLSKYSMDEKSEDFLFRSEVNQKVGIIDAYGNTIIEMKFDEISTLNYGEKIKYYIVQLNNKIGIIDEKGNQIIPINFEPELYIDPIFSEGLILLKSNGEKYYYNENGDEIIKLSASAAYSFSNGLAMIKKDNLFGYIDKNGDQVIDCKYAEAYTFNENFDYTPVKYNGLWGVIDKKSNAIIDFIYRNIEYKPDFDVFLVQKNNLTGILSISNGKLNTREYYNEVKILKPDLFLVKKDKIWGIVDLIDNVIIPINYDEIQYYTNFFIAKKDKLWGVIVPTGNVIIPFNYHDIKYFDNLNLFFLKKSKKWNIHYFDNINESIFSCDKYICLEIFYIIVQKNEFYLINNHGSTRLEIDDVNKSNDQYYIVLRNGRMGVMNNVGEYIIPADYEDIDFLNKHLFIIKSDKKFGVVDYSNKIILKPIYDKVEFVGGILIFELNGLVGFLIPENSFYSELIYNQIKVLNHNNKQLIIAEQEDLQSISTKYFVHKLENSKNDFSIILLSKDYGNFKYITAMGRIGGGLYGEHISKIENVDNWDITKGFFASNFDVENWEYAYNGANCKSINDKISLSDIELFKILKSELMSNYIFYDDVNDEKPKLKHEFIQKISNKDYDSNTATWYFKNLSQHWGLKYSW